MNLPFISAGGYKRSLNFMLGKNLQKDGKSGHGGMEEA